MVVGLRRRPAVGFRFGFFVNRLFDERLRQCRRLHDVRIVALPVGEYDGPMPVKVVFLRAGEKPPEGAFFVPLTSWPDGKPSIPFERVGEAVVRAGEQGHDTVYVEFLSDN